MGKFWSGNGQFNNPQGVAVDSLGNVYVTDNANNRVEKFTSGGVFGLAWGTGGSGNSQFNGVIGIAADTSGNIFVGDFNNNRVQKFDSNGNYLTQWGGAGSGKRAVRRRGRGRGPVHQRLCDRLYNNRVQRFSSTGVSPPNGVPQAPATASSTRPLAWR